MFTFLSRKRPKKTLKQNTSPVLVEPNTSRQHSSIQRELIRVVLKDTLRLHGIPLDWLACEVIIISKSADADELHIQLMLMKWKEKLLRYAPALQQQLLLGLDRFDPMADHSKYVVSWRFSPACANPYTRMPDPRFWQETEPPKANEVQTPALDRRQNRRKPNAPFLEPSLFEAVDRSTHFQSTDLLPLS